MSAQKRPTLRQVLLLLVFLLALQLPGLGREFSTRGEPREALVAQSMLSSGDWILPQAYGGAVPSKPPFTHWLMSLCGLALGEFSELAARLPTVLSCTMFLMVFYLLLFARYDSERALWTVVILATSVEWFRTATGCRVDGVFSSLLCGAFLSFYCWQERSFRGYPFLLVTLLAGAMLAKGPVALVLFSGIYLAWSFFERERLRDVIFRGVGIVAPVVLVAGLWYLLAYLARPDDFYSKVWYENVQRFASQQDDEPHKKSAFYLYGTIFLGLLPWALLLIPGLTTLRKQSVGHIRQWWKGSDSFERFSLLCIFLVIVFFSIPAGKRSVYLLPIYPFLSFYLSRYLVSAFSHVWLTRVYIGLTSGVAILVTLVVFICPILGAGDLIAGFLSGRSLETVTYFNGLLSEWYKTSFWQFLLGFLLLAGVGVWALIPALSQKHSPFIRLTALFSCLFVVGNGFVFPVMARDVSGYSFAQQIEPLINKKRNHLCSYNTEFYSLSFYLQRIILRFEERSKECGYIFAYKKDLEALEAALDRYVKMRVLVKSGSGIIKPLRQVVLVEIEPSLGPFD